MQTKSKKQENPLTKDHALYDPICITFPEKLKTESRLVAASSEGDVRMGSDC